MGNHAWGALKWVLGTQGFVIPICRPFIAVVFHNIFFKIGNHHIFKQKETHLSKTPCFSKERHETIMEEKARPGHQGHSSDEGFQEPWNVMLAEVSTWKAPELQVAHTCDPFRGIEPHSNLEQSPNQPGASACWPTHPSLWAEAVRVGGGPTGQEGCIRYFLSPESRWTFNPPLHSVSNRCLQSQLPGAPRCFLRPQRPRSLVGAWAHPVSMSHRDSCHWLGGLPQTQTRSTEATAPLSVGLTLGELSLGNHNKHIHIFVKDRHDEPIFNWAVSLHRVVVLSIEEYSLSCSLTEKVNKPGRQSSKLWY